MVWLATAAVKVIWSAQPFWLGPVGKAQGSALFGVSHIVQSKVMTGLPSKPPSRTFS